MIKWYDRIGNRIEMKLYEDADKPEFEWVKGNVIKGYRYRDGIVTMESDDGRIIWCGIESGDFRKSEDSLGDFISNADRIRSMSNEELLDFICSIEAYDNGSVKIIEGGCALCSVTDVENWLQSETGN